MQHSQVGVSHRWVNAASQRVTRAAKPAKLPNKRRASPRPELAACCCCLFRSIANSATSRMGVWPGPAGTGFPLMQLMTAMAASTLGVVMMPVCWPFVWRKDMFASIHSRPYTPSMCRMRSAQLASSVSCTRCLTYTRFVGSRVRSAGACRCAGKLNAARCSCSYRGGGLDGACMQQPPSTERRNIIRP